MNGRHAHYTTFACDLYFDETATTDIYTLSLHDALPISIPPRRVRPLLSTPCSATCESSPSGTKPSATTTIGARSEEHTSELQSRGHLVCRLLLEKKKECNEKKMEINKS